MRANYRSVKGNPIQTEEATLQLRLMEGRVYQAKRTAYARALWLEGALFF